MRFENNIASKFKTQPKLLYKYMNEKRAIKTNIGAIEAANGDVVVDKYAIATELNNYFHSVYIDGVDANVPVLDKVTENKLRDIELSQQDIELRLKALDKTKSLGVDSVHPRVLNECSSAFSSPLYLSFKKSIDSGTFPDIWKHANVTPLFKKGSRLRTSYYRPVSLTSIPCKLLERIIAGHLVKNNILTKKQHGFMKGRSCTTNLMEYIDLLTNHIFNGKAVDVLYTDFKKAFDSVSHRKLCAKLADVATAANFI